MFGGVFGVKCFSALGYSLEHYHVCEWTWATRAGTFFRMEGWDWNREVSDDPLGSFEVKVGEELLSQKARLDAMRLDGPSGTRRG